MVDKLHQTYGPQDSSAVPAQPFLEGKVLADPECGKSGHVDMLLSMADSNRCIYDESESTPNRSFRAWSPSLGGLL